MVPDEIFIPTIVQEIGMYQLSRIHEVSGEEEKRMMRSPWTTESDLTHSSGVQRYRSRILSASIAVTARAQTTIRNRLASILGRLYVEETN